MYYLQTRWYDPAIGRFISPDSVDYLDPESFGGLNLYAYCLNNPIMYVDPTGHFSWLMLGFSVLISIGFELLDDGIDGGLFDGSHDWKDYTGALVSGIFGAFGSKSIYQALYSIAGGMLDSAISGDMKEDGFLNTLCGIVLSTFISYGISNGVKKIATNIKVSSIIKTAEEFGNHAANKQLRTMGAAINMGAGIVKNNSKKIGALTKAIFNSKWSEDLISAQIISSIAGGFFSTAYGYVNNLIISYFLS